MLGRGYIATVLLLLASASAYAGRDDEMTFSEKTPCSGTASFCGAYVLAQGVITPRTPDIFAAFLERLSHLRPDIYLDSRGGNLIGGMRLGLLIRKHGLNTYVGGPYEHQLTLGVEPQTVVEAAVCLSACAYAFLGGVGREVGDHGTFAVHQFASPRGDMGERAAQQLTSTITNYVAGMGVDTRLVNDASSTDASTIRQFSRVKLQELRVDNSAPPRMPWQIKTQPSGKLNLVALQHLAKRDGHLLLSFDRTPNLGLVLIASYFVNQRFRTDNELRDALREFNGLYLSINQREHPLEVLRAWTLERKEGQAIFVTMASVPKSIETELSRARSLRFVVSLHKAYDDIDPSTDLSVSGLAGGLAALARSK